MADAVVSGVLEQIAALLKEQVSFHVNLVKGAKEAIRSLAGELETVRHVLDDAERRGHKEELVKAWLLRLERTSYEMEDVLGEWNYAIRKLQIEKAAKKKLQIEKQVRSFIPSCFCCKNISVRHDIAKKIIDVKKKLDEVLKEKDRYGFAISQPVATVSHNSWRVTTSFADLEVVRGRDFDRDNLVGKLTGRQEELGIHVVSIVGAGGLGKTTLAQLVYNDSEVELFFTLRIWICVSDPFDRDAIAKGILEGVGRASSSIPTQSDALLKVVKESISGKRFLLILDDVWTEESKEWEPLEACLKCGGKGSKVLVTTRSERVAKAMGTDDNDIHRPELLSHEDCWSLLHRISLSGRSEGECRKFQDIGMKIASKCNGLPLAVCVLGSLLRDMSSPEEWESVFNSEIWQLEEAEQLFRHLLLSYNQLSPPLKRCFSYCAVFPKDFRIDVEKLIEYWIAQGYMGYGDGDMELKGQKYFQNLAMRSLFQDFERRDFDKKIMSCKMHDIVHDFAQSLRRDRSSVTLEAEMKKSTCHRCSCSLIYSVKTYRSLVSCTNCEYNCDCLTSLRVLDIVNDDIIDLHEIQLEMEQLIHLRWLGFYKMNISDEDIKIICQLYNLHVLCLIDSSLWEIPSEIENLTQLRHLKLRDISILWKLPKEIGNLTQLKHLDLHYFPYLKELPKEIGNLTQLKHLDLHNIPNLEELPKEIGDLTQLIHLSICYFDSMEELPKEIGNLTQLNYLYLSNNACLRELPKEIGNLTELKHLDLCRNDSLKELPESIHGLINLKHIFINHTKSKLPQGVSNLTGLLTLSQFWGGSGWGKLGWLKNLNHLTGTLQLNIELIDDSKDIIEDAREADLGNKMHLHTLIIHFDKENDKANDVVRTNVMDALEPHLNLQNLLIQDYKGSKLPGWITSPLLQLRSIKLISIYEMPSLPPFGKLPCLEELEIYSMEELQLLGKEFLGITTRSSSNSNTIVGFPKLKKLKFQSCDIWEEWEDITAEEEDSASVSFMPHLMELIIFFCNSLTALPERLLGKKAASLGYVRIATFDKQSALIRRYQDREGAIWDSYARPCLKVPFKPIAIRLEEIRNQDEKEDA